MKPWYFCDIFIWNWNIISFYFGVFNGVLYLMSNFCHLFLQKKSNYVYKKKSFWVFFWHYTPQNIHSILSLRHCQHWSVFLWYWNCVVYYSFSYTKQNVPTQYRGDKTSPHNTDVKKRPLTEYRCDKTFPHNTDVTKRPHTIQMWQNVPFQNMSLI